MLTCEIERMMLIAFKCACFILWFIVHFVRNISYFFEEFCFSLFLLAFVLMFLSVSFIVPDILCHI